MQLECSANETLVNILVKVSSTIVGEGNSLGLHIILVGGFSLVTLGSQEKHSHWVYWELDCERKGALLVQQNGLLQTLCSWRSG